VTATSSSTASAGRVFIIGAGPGDPNLISVRGLRLLSNADVVVYDRDVEALLRWARPDAERLEVGAPAERETAQDAISMLLAEKARDGQTVARLKWGDAFVFDSGAKEALFLHEQGVPFEVVPGIPAAVGATAYAGIPITYPGGPDAVVLLRGHEGATDAPPDVDWTAVAGIDGTLVCYAGGRLAATILRALLDRGVPADRTAALIHNGTTPTQQTVTGTIAQLLDSTSTSPNSEPALLVVGDVANLREHLRWFDERPLFGKRIVVTRSREQARGLVDALENLGAQAIEAPTFRLVPSEDPEAIERAAASLEGYAWVIFESANAVARFLSVLLRGPSDLRALGGVSLCAIGPSTADQLLAHGLKPDVVIPEFRAEGVGDTIAAKRPIDGQRVLVVRPDHLRDALARDLTRHGAQVTDLIAYRTAPESADSPAVQDLYRRLLDGHIDAVTFTSPTAVGRFVALIGEEQAADLLNITVVAAIGPVTAAAAGELGITTTVMPEVYTVDGLVKALVEYFQAST
jgi:uroporphyrinogen III methyltransferase/synthase